MSKRIFLSASLLLFLVILAAAVSARWIELDGSATGGGISNTSGNSGYPAIAIDSLGNIFVAWHDNTGVGNDEIYVKKFDGINWVGLASSASGRGISNNSGYSLYPVIAIGPGNVPFVAWRDDTGGNAEIYVKKFNGTNWVEVGTGSASGAGVSNTTLSSNMPSLAISQDSYPVVAWQDNTVPTSEIYIKRFNGAAWVDVGSGSATGGGISNNPAESVDPSLAIGPNGRPAVAWSESEIYMRQFNGATWAELPAGAGLGGRITSNPGTSISPSVVVDSNNNIIVAWSDRELSMYEIHVKKFDGAAWGEFSSGSASGTGISNTPNASSTPSIALDSSNNPAVAWIDGPSGNEEIYFRRFNGSSWIELSNSARWGGISNNSGQSLLPSVDIGSDGLPVVVWQEASPGDWEIYLKKYVPAEQPPTAAIQIQGSNNSFDWNTSQTFDASSSSAPDSVIISYQWDFDYDNITFIVDEDTGTAPFATHTFNQNGTYTVAVRIISNYGETAIAVLNVIVNPVPTGIINIAPGWNLVGIPAVIGQLYARDLIEMFNANDGNVTLLMKWDGSGWATQPEGMPFAGFEVNVGEGYAVYSNAASTLPFFGSILESVTLNFGRGYTLFSVPAVNFTSTDIMDEAAAQGGNCSMVFGFDAALQAWGPFDFGGDNPFVLVPGEGYVAYCLNSSSILLDLVNDAPYFNPALVDQGTIPSGYEWTYDTNCNDVDSSTITYADDTTKFNIDALTGEIRWTPLGWVDGSVGGTLHTFGITCDDGSSGSVTNYFDITVTALASGEFCTDDRQCATGECDIGNSDQCA